MSSIATARHAPLSARAVEKLAESAFVGGVAGLQMVVSPGGTRSWRLFYRVAGGDGRRLAMSLGRYPEVGLAEARRRAAEALAKASDGVDPKNARAERVAKARISVAEAYRRYLATCAASNDPKTLADKESAFRTHLAPTLGAAPIVDVDRRQVLDLLDALADRPAVRRVLFSYLSHFFRWAVERDLVATNPLAGVKPPKPVAARERVLAEGEIRALWFETGTIAELARLALLTAQRKGSLLALRRDEVDLERGFWSIPGAQMKSAKPHLVPLTAMAHEIVARQPPLAGPFVFGVGTDGAQAFAGASAGMRRLQQRLAADWRFHDLRRTAVTLAQRGGAPLDAVRALTQHKTAGVIGVYARHAFETEKREVAAIIEREILAILG